MFKQPAAAAEKPAEAVPITNPLVISGVKQLQDSLLRLEFICEYYPQTLDFLQRLITEIKTQPAIDITRLNKLIDVIFARKDGLCSLLIKEVYTQESKRKFKRETFFIAALVRSLFSDLNWHPILICYAALRYDGYVKSPLQQEIITTANPLDFSINKLQHLYRQLPKIDFTAIAALPQAEAAIFRLLDIVEHSSIFVQPKNPDLLYGFLLALHHPQIAAQHIVWGWLVQRLQPKYLGVAYIMPYLDYVRFKIDIRSKIAQLKKFKGFTYLQCDYCHEAASDVEMLTHSCKEGKICHSCLANLTCAEKHTWCKVCYM